jgi:hypothetical protein
VQKVFCRLRRQNFYIEATLGSLILLRKINEPSVASNYYLARSAELCFAMSFVKSILPPAAAEFLYLSHAWFMDFAEQNP